MKKIYAIILSTMMLLSFASCSSRNKTQSPEQNQMKGVSQTKTDIKTVLKELIVAGTLKQEQADKIAAAFEKDPNAAPGPNSPLKSLVNDKTITEDQEHAVMDKMFGGPPTGQLAGGLGGSSIDTTSIKNKYMEVAYGIVSKTQTLDIYIPNEGNGPFPVIIAVHGGAFMMGDSKGGDVAPMLEGVNHGYVVVSVNYRLSGEAIFPAAISDVKAAIRFIKANASKYNINPDKIAAWGDSAGGNLVSMIGTTGTIDSLNGDNKENLNVTSDVKAVVDWFGPLNFLKMDEQFAISGIKRTTANTSTESSPESKYIGQLITKDSAMTERANPETYIDTLKASTAPSFLIQHGTNDGNVPTQQSIDFATKLKAAIGDVKVKIDLLQGATHGSKEFSTTDNLNKVFAFLDSVFK